MFEEQAMKPIRPIVLSTMLLAVSVRTFATERPAGDEPWQTLAFVGAGKVHPLPQATYQPRPEETYSIVFSITKPAAQPGEVSPSLRSVARILNLYASAGVPLSHLRFVVVIDGDAIDAALDNSHYRRKYGVDNPNLALLRTFRNAGIEVAAGGQTLSQDRDQGGAVAPEVTPALSGPATITNLQQQGYVLMSPL
jgi:intracellular sulfur oxidation DsrE/DsrF family protein